MTLKELAGLLGLSPTTVSRALGGYPEVSEETRRAVREAAAAHGYRPNRRAAALASGRAMAIGHVITTSETDELVNPVFADFLAGAGEVYAAAGYDMLMSVVPEDREDAAYAQMISARSVDGVILHGPRPGDPRVGLLQEAGLPFVVHGRAPETGSHDFVDVANTRAFRTATDHLLDLGHSRIALVNGPEAFDFASRRRRGWTEALEARHLAADLVRDGPMSEGNGYAFARQMLRDGATAFAVASHLMALGVRRAVQEAGLTLGDDVSVVMFDDELSYLRNDGDPPPFTAIRSSVRAAGRRCAEVLLARVAGPDGALIGEVWDCDLVLGASSGPSRNSSRRKTSA
ncbi:substrate-binding domain-containing protein [Jannaschia aquimarina]|uniref:RafR_1 protein n=1 Tax=Jannaschia aquimarina TaxID=935700 RepID=A0A0D1CTS7_9RHOB|nr:substrate-binding domain-containing protein [Jannaschia aquimarina]KIT18177.1 HTH-type transcriptional regulator RafR [Jannaschia aquimarina]SNT40415.1 transcriptional regulator, LacI family [Jannaschia aquimarina]